MNIILNLQLLLLLMVANGAPVLARRLMGRRFAVPVDGGYRLADGYPLFGLSKTWRGLIAAVILTAVAAYGLGFDYRHGAWFGILAMAGDLLSSFIKRRLGYPPSSRASGLDQIPESLLPLLGLAGAWQLGVIDILLVVVLFLVVSLILSRLLYVIGVRRQPY